MQIGRHSALSRGAGKLHGTVMRRGGLGVFIDLDLLLGRERVAGRAVHIRNDAARARVAIDKGLIALGFDVFSHLIENGGGKDLIDAAVCHRGILVKLGSLLNAPLHAARDAEDKPDAALGLGKEKLGIHFIGCAAESGHGRDAAFVRPCRAGDGFDIGTGQHTFSSGCIIAALQTSAQ